MADTLIYRIPGEKASSFSGKFVEVSSFDEVDGFVVSRFCNDQIYAFHVEEGDDEVYCSANKPNVISEADYMKSGQSFLNRLSEKGLRKAVLSRVKEVPFRKNAQQYFYCLCESYPEALVYLISSPLFGTWVGATPELLLACKSEKVRTVALAGTKKKDDKEVWSEKELEEQQCVQDFISSKLSQLEIEGVSKSDRGNLIAGPVKHLITRFEFSRGGISLTEIVNALHPTPAVSGLPQAEAIELIKETEVHERDLYAGVVGWKSEEETQLFVNLRCAQLIEDHAYLYLGGGYTVDSDVQAEWDETENKARTLLNVLENL